VTGEQERHDLVAHLAVAEAAFLVAREQQDRQHVTLVRASFATLVDHSIDDFIE
jgi:hypothetical protein